MSTALEDVIGTEELREQIIQRAAEMALGRWHPAHADDAEARSLFEGDLQRRVEEMFQAEVLEQLKAPVANAIEDALTGEFQPTDQYGQPRSGPKRTLREVIAERVEQEIKVPQNRPGYSSGRSDTALGEWLSREITKKVHEQLWKDFAQIADEVTKAAAAEIQRSIGYLVDAKKRR